MKKHKQKRFEANLNDLYTGTQGADKPPIKKLTVEDCMKVYDPVDEVQFAIQQVSKKQYKVVYRYNPANELANIVHLGRFLSGMYPTKFNQMRLFSTFERADIYVIKQMLRVSIARNKQRQERANG